jgi:hypothetical protein
MNCFSGSIFLIFLFGLTACGAPASETEDGQGTSSFAVHYTISPNPADGSIQVEMQVKQTRGQLRELGFSLLGANTSHYEGDGELVVDDTRLSWQPERTGGSLKWRAEVSHQRGNGGFDAWLDNDWGIFRAEDIIPRAQTRTLRGAISKTSMSFELPGAWTAVSEYSTLSSRIAIDNPERRFDQPRGWIAMGEIGVRRETIAGTRVAVVAPEGQGARRMDMLALLNWTLPELNAVIPEALPRLTIISAGDPMWRGGLSAPASMFMHASRPLISENATSTLVHEVFHVALGVTATKGFDWIVEGLAEYYSLDLLQRGGAITARRYQRALEKQTQWADEAEQLCGDRSSGAVTALAVVKFRQLDQEIRRKSASKLSLDNVVAELANSHSRVSLESLQDIVGGLLQEASVTLHVDNLPGCQQIQADVGA